MCFLITRNDSFWFCRGQLSFYFFAVCSKKTKQMQVFEETNSPKSSNFNTILHTPLGVRVIEFSVKTNIHKWLYIPPPKTTTMHKWLYMNSLTKNLLSTNHNIWILYKNYYPQIIIYETYKQTTVHKSLSVNSWNKLLSTNHYLWILETNHYPHESLSMDSPNKPYVLSTNHLWNLETIHSPHKSLPMDSPNKLYVLSTNHGFYKQTICTIRTNHYLWILQTNYMYYPQIIYGILKQSTLRTNHYLWILQTNYMYYPQIIYGILKQSTLRTNHYLWILETNYPQIIIHKFLKQISIHKS